MSEYAWDEYDWSEWTGEDGRRRDESPHRWILTNNSSDLLNSLEHCALTYTLTRSDQRNWKWCVMAAYSAAQIAMVIVLEAQGEFKHLHRDDRKKMPDEGTLDPPGVLRHLINVRLNSFEHLIANVWPLLNQDAATPKLRANILNLKSIRDEWTHFGRYGSHVPVWHARAAVFAGIKLVKILPLPPRFALYRTETEGARHEVAMASLTKLLLAENGDDWVGRR